MNSEHNTYAGEAGNVMGSLSLSTAAAMCCLASHVALKEKGRLNSVLVFCVYIAMFILIARSGARGQLVSVIMAALIMLSLHKPLLKITFNLIVVAIVSWVVIRVIPPLLMNEEQLNLLGRWDVSRLVTGMEDRGIHVGALWQHYEKMGFHGQLFGLGSSYSFMPRAGGIYPHNVPFEVLCEEGVLGFLLYSFLVCRTVWLLYLASAKNKLSTATSVPLALFIFLGLLSLKSGSLLTGYAFLMLIIAGPRVYCASTRPGSLRSSLAGKI
jgi:O-antigen ligase